VDGNRHTADEARASATERVGRIAVLGAVVAAFAASLCCIGPVLFVTVGVGASLGSSFEPLRPFLTVLIVAALAVGFYTVYARKPQPTGCAPGEACTVPTNRRRNEVILWTATVLAAILWSFNYWSTLLL
jgi:mercuric ion transport protein